MLKNNIKRFRSALGLSQEELAARLHVVRQTVSKWEKGLSVPDADMLIALARALETTPAVLLGPEEEPGTEERQPDLAGELEELNTRLARQLEKNRRLRRLISIATLTIGMLGLLVALLPRFQAAFSGLLFSRAANAIGGADGPTAIFITGSGPDWAAGAMFAILIVLGVWGLVRTRGRKSGEK